MSRTADTAVFYSFVITIQHFTVTVFSSFVYYLFDHCFTVCKLVYIKLLCIILCGKIYIPLLNILHIISKEYPEVYKPKKKVVFSSIFMVHNSCMHALVLASLKTWNPKESAGRVTMLLASCSTGSSSGREVLSTSCSR